MSILVTGAAGFIGSHVASALLDQGAEVVGFDDLNAYYDVGLKEARLARLLARPGFSFHRLNIADRAAVFAALGSARKITGIVHLAAQAGVRYSLENPYAYIEANVMGQVVMLEAARRLEGLRNFVYASSSSVYGANQKQPFSVADRVDAPISIYAATKRSDELIAHSYAHLYGLPCIGLRFFTVYGPWGRPDMAAYRFADAIMAGRPIQVFNHGQMARDFTYIDDIVAGTIAALHSPPASVGGEPPHKIYNLGNNRPEPLLTFIAILETALGRASQIEFLPMQSGDVPETSADIELSRRDLGFEPKTPLDEGLPHFVRWYKRYHALG